MVTELTKLELLGERGVDAMPVWSTLLTQSLCGTKVSDLLPEALG